MAGIGCGKSPRSTPSKVRSFVKALSKFTKSSTAFESQITKQTMGGLKSLRAEIRRRNLEVFTQRPDLLSEYSVGW